MYDIIGDVHGHYRLLKKLLIQLGYSKTEIGFRHPKRKAIFVGDFINRGSENRKTIRAIRKMVENKSAYAILGNHEVNAIIYHLKDKDGSPLVKKPQKYFLSLYKTINEFSDYPEEWKRHLKWMRSLPLSIDLGEIRVVHACWNEKAIKIIEDHYFEKRIKKSTFRKIYSTPSSDLAKSIWLLTKGVNLKMPADLKVINNKGVAPRSLRIKWWENPNGKTFNEMLFDSKYKMPSYTIPSEIVPVTFPYTKKEPLVFIGHYCRFKGSVIVKQNICCVDSCVTGTKTLTAYRWFGEKELTEQNVIRVK